MPGSSFEDVYLVNPAQVRPSSPDAVAALESELGVRMPAGYGEYVQRLGDGALGHFVRVHSPTNLPGLTREWQERIREYWFWDTSEAEVTPESLQQQGVLVADTFDGDEVCFHPAIPDALLVLPRNEDVATRIGPGLVPGLDWLLSGVLNPWVEGWTFESPTNRTEVRQELTSGHHLVDAARVLEAEGQHSHVVELAERRTFFLPAIGGRLSLYQPEDDRLAMDLTHDADADPATVSRLLILLGGA